MLHLRTLRRRGLPIAHPRTRDRLRALLAHHSLPWLVAAFIGLVLLIAAVAALFLTFYRGLHSFWWWWEQSILVIGGQSPNAQAFSQAPISGTSEVVLSLVGIILPALILGIIVFKAFVSQTVFTVRERIRLMPISELSQRNQEELKRCRADDYCLALRVYSSTPLTLVEVKFSLYARVRAKSPKGSRIVRNHQLVVCRGEWPIALPHVPYTVLVPLWNGDVHQHVSGTRKLVAIQENGLEERCDLLLHIAGNVPELNAPFFEAHWFEAESTISAEAFGEIDVNYETPSHRWLGWERFG